MSLWLDALTTTLKTQAINSKPLYFTNMLFTFTFLGVHISEMILVFDKWNNYDAFTLAWANIQYALVVYSLLLLFTPHAFQIVLLFAKVVI